MFMKKVGRPPKSDKEKLIEELYEEEPMTQITARMPVSLHAKLKIYVANNRISIKEFLLQRIKEAIGNEEDGNKL